MSELKKRIDWIDGLKAFAIFLIVLGHAINGESKIWHLIYGFNVPLFIIISGMTINVKEDKFNHYVQKKIKRIILPYYIGGTISIIVYLLVARYFGDNKLPLYKCIIGLIWANGETGIMRWNLPLWFLPTFFIIQILSFFIEKKSDTIKNTSIIILCEIILASVVYNLKIITNLPFGIETALYLLPFLSYGKLIKLLLPNIENINNIKKYMISIVCFIVSSIIILSQNNIDYVSDQYRIYGLFVFSAITMSTALILIFMNIKKYPKCILEIGRGTLTILLLHKFPLLFFERVCPVVKDIYISNRIITSFIISILSIVICILCKKIIVKCWGKYINNEG